MASLHWQRFVSALLFLHCIQSKSICSFSDEKCMVKGGNIVYKMIISGIKEEGVLDPIFQDKLDGELQGLKYKLTNVTLTGLSQCVVIRLKCYIEKLSCDFVLGCPQVTLAGAYEVKGTLGTLELDGKGTSTFSADDYEIQVKGKYEKHVDEKDQKIHMIVKGLDIESEPKGKMYVKVVNQNKGQQAKSDLVADFFNQNAVEMEKMFRKPVIYVLLKKFFDKYAEVMTTYPLDDLVPKEEN